MKRRQLPKCMILLLLLSTLAPVVVEAGEQLSDRQMNEIVGGNWQVGCWHTYAGHKPCPDGKAVNCDGDEQACWIVRVNQVAYCKPLGLGETGGMTLCWKTYDPCPQCCTMAWKYKGNDPCVCNDSTFVSFGPNNCIWATDVGTGGIGCTGPF